MPKFLYSPIPATVLCNPELSPLMKLRYGILLGAAFNRQILKKSLAGIAELWAEAEGEPIDAGSAGAYLGKMAAAGLIQREQVNRYTWTTHLLYRYDKNRQTATNKQPTNSHRQPQTDSQQTATEISETPTPCGGLESETPTLREGLMPASGAYLTKEVVVDDLSELNHQQQQLVNYLKLLGVLPDTALSFALEGVGLEDAVYWGEYAKQSKGLRNPAGFVVTKLGSGEEPPDITLHICPLCRCSPCTCGFW